MPKKSDKNRGVKEIELENSSLPVVEVKHPGEDAGEEFGKAQDEALVHYRLTGEAGVFIDPTRDQEPDIAPELGVSPHPELANPAPPAASFSGRALDVNQNPMLVPVEEKEENAAEATEAFNEALAKREEAFQAATPGPAALPVTIVDAPEPVEGLVSVPADESPKARSASPDAQLSQDLPSDDDK